MNSEDMAILSFYEEKATVSDKSEVFLVQHRETGERADRSGRKGA